MAVGAFVAFPSASAYSESLDEAMAAAYLNNPTLNAERARQRVTDENVPQALSAFRPSVNGVGTVTGTSGNTGPSSSYSASLTVQQTLFSGFRNLNGLRGAESSVKGGQATLRGVEQVTLLDTVKVFMNLVQAQAILNLRAQSIEFYRTQLQTAQSMLNSGTATRVDVSLVEARLAAAQSDYFKASANLSGAVAAYQKVVGHAPMSLGLARSVDALLPVAVDAAVALALEQHPSAVAARYAVEAADYAVKVAEGALLPNVALNGTLMQGDPTTIAANGSASLSARLTIPIFSGGVTSSRVRAARELLAQRRLESDAASDEIRRDVSATWALLDAARSAARSADAQVGAQERLLSDVLEQRRVGQATTVDVLNAEQDLLTARVAQVDAQRDRVVNAYALLAATGGLTAERLNLAVAIH